MGKLNWGRFQRYSRRENPVDARAEKENGQEYWEGGQGNGMTDVQREGGGMHQSSVGAVDANVLPRRQPEETTPVPAETGNSKESLQH